MSDSEESFDEYNSTLDPDTVTDWLNSGNVTISASGSFTIKEENLMNEETYNVEDTNVPPTPVNVEDNPNNNFPISTTKTILHEIQDHIRQIAAQLERLRQEQRRITIPVPAEHYQILKNGHKEIAAVIIYDEKRLNDLLDTFCEPAEMEYILQLLDQLTLQSKQVDIFNNELDGIQRSGSAPIAQLTIISQPFPASVKQNKNLEETLSVRLLTGARTEPVNVQTTLKGQIVSSGSSRSKKNQIGVENAERALVDGLATFNDLKFPNGTRKKSVQMTFQGRVTIKDMNGLTHTLSLESEPSRPFVVKTNENQWHEAEGVLLQQSAFLNKNEISWPRFINWLNKYYLMATKQTSQAPVRPLTGYDIDYLHSLSVFNKGPTVSQKQFDTFWTWFGPMLHKIRYQRHINGLWTRGFICGFLNRDEVNAVLGNEQIGTFLIRFSERNPGAFVIAYVAIEEGKKKVHHYLMQDDDTFAAKKTLPDFLHECRDFTILLQICYDIHEQRRILRRCEKDAVLKEYYKPLIHPPGSGYQNDIKVFS